MPNPYSKIQYIAYQALTLYPTNPCAAKLRSKTIGAPEPRSPLIAMKSPSRAVCNEPWFMDDALVRVQRLRDVAVFAKTKLQQTGKLGSDDTLKVFVAPEFYFKQGADGYPHAGLNGPTISADGTVKEDAGCSVDGIIEALRMTFATDEFKHWLIVPGTIFSHEGTTGKRAVYVQVKDASHKVVSVTDLDAVDWSTHYISDLQVQPSVPPTGYLKVERDFVQNYFNTTVAIRGGSVTSGDPQQYVLGWKGPMSWIDVAWFGPKLLHSWKTLPVKDFGPLDPRNRDAHKDQVYSALLRDWETQKERFFKVDNLTFGLEVCLDHASGILQDLWTKWDTQDGNSLARSKKWVRNDVTVDLKSLMRFEPAELGVDATKLVDASEDSTSPSALAKVDAQTVDVSKVGAVRMRLDRALRRLMDLEKSEARTLEAKPAVNVQLITACGMSIQRGKVVTTKGFVMLCDGSWGSSSQRVEFQQINGTVMTPVSTTALDEEVPADLQIDEPMTGIPPGAWYKQKVVASEAVKLP